MEDTSVNAVVREFLVTCAGAAGPGHAAVVAVNEDGRITAQANGTATVTASIGSISDSVTVTVAQTVSRIQLVPETVTLTAIEQRAQIAATPLDANGHPVATDVGFASSDSMVATVDGGGLIIALRNGMTTITASAGPVELHVSPGRCVCTAGGGSLTFGSFQSPS